MGFEDRRDVLLDGWWEVRVGEVQGGLSWTEVILLLIYANSVHTP